MVQIIEDKAHSRPVVDPDYIRDRESRIVILKDQSPSDAQRESQNIFGESLACGACIAKDATDVSNDDGFGAELHAIKDVCLQPEIRQSSSQGPLVRSVRDGELPRMDRESETGFGGNSTALSKFVPALADLIRERDKIRMGCVGRQRRGHAIHTNVLGGEIGKHISEIGEADAQMGRVLPTPAIMTPELRPAKGLDNEAESHDVGR
jgi:hypothetical protein